MLLPTRAVIRGPLMRSVRYTANGMKVACASPKTPSQTGLGARQRLCPRISGMPPSGPLPRFGDERRFFPGRPVVGTEADAPRKTVR